MIIYLEFSSHETLKSFRLNFNNFGHWGKKNQNIYTCTLEVFSTQWIWFWNYFKQGWSLCDQLFCLEKCYKICYDYLCKKKTQVVLFVFHLEKPYVCPGLCQHRPGQP